MTRFRKILFVAADIPGIEGALEIAVLLAEQISAWSGCSVSAPWTCKFCQSSIRRIFGSWPLKKRRRNWKGWSRRFWTRNPQIRTELLSGTPFLEIIREVLRKEHDLVIMAPMAP